MTAFVDVLWIAFATMVALLLVAAVASLGAGDRATRRGRAGHRSAATGRSARIRTLMPLSVTVRADERD